MTKDAPVVKKSNILARARWSPSSVWEPRLVALVASKIAWEDQDFQTYRIHVSELFGPSYGGRDFRELETAVDRCMGRVITLKDENGWTKYTLFSKCRFARDEGMLEVQFHPDLKSHYLNLKQYVKYNLTEFLALPSIYSQRIFEILKSWADKGEVVIPLSELHAMLDTPESLRVDFGQFRRRVLVKAMADITSRVHFRFAWEPIKRGRTVESIRFIFSPSEIARIAKDNEEKAEDKQRKRNKMLFESYMACFEKYGSGCEGGHEKRAVCELCKKMR